MLQSLAHTRVVVGNARGLIMQVRGSESLLSPPSYCHSSREGSSIVLPDLALRRVRGRLESDHQVMFPGTSFVLLCLITSMHWVNL